MGQVFGGGGGIVEIPGGGRKKDSLPILGLQRLASLLSQQTRGRVVTKSQVAR